MLTAADDVAERDRLAEEAKARLGISEFHVSGSLRGAWYEAQRRDGSLAGILRKTEHPFVLGGDGLLEREVNLKGEAAAWVDEKLEEEVQRGQLVRSSWALLFQQKKLLLTRRAVRGG